MASIETGVDKLVKIVNRERKVEINDAAKELGVPVTLVQEWADFLEQEGLIDTEYSLYKSFLLTKRMSKDEVGVKRKEYESKKDVFTRKIEVALQQLDDEQQNFEKIKEKYFALKENVGDDLDAVKSEIDELHHYHDLKKVIDQDIIAQKGEYQKEIGKIEEHLSAEEQRYDKILQHIDAEELQIQHEGVEMAELGEEEDILVKRINAMQDVVKSVLTQVSDESSNIKIHKERLEQLKALAEKLQHELKEKKQKEIDPLLKISKDQEAKIQRVEDDILARVKQRIEKDEPNAGAETVTKSFQEFFDKRAKTESALRNIEQMHVDLKKELIDFVLKAKAFDVALQGGNANIYIKELEGKFGEFEQKKQQINMQVDELKELIHDEDASAQKTAQVTIAK